MAEVEGGLTMDGVDYPYNKAHDLWDFYYSPKAKARRHGEPPPQAVRHPRRQSLAKPAGRANSPLTLMRSRTRRAEADILESERRYTFCHAADGSRLLLNKDGNRVLIKGQAVPFVFYSNKIVGTYENFRRGALSWDHGCELLLGHGGPEVANTANGTLRIWEEKDGLKFSAVIHDSSLGRAAVNSARFATGVSINFRARERVQNGLVLEVREAWLNPIAIIMPPKNPAYKSTWVSVKSEPPP